MGKMVVDYLLTAESIKKKIITPQFRHEAIRFIQEKVKAVKADDITVRQVLEKMGFGNAEQQVEAKVVSIASNKVQEWYRKHKGNRLQDVLPVQVSAAVDEKVPQIADLLIQKGKEFFSSIEGKKQLERMIEDFFEDKGMMWNMLQMFMKNERLVDKIQPEILQFLQAEGTKTFLTELIQKEWHTLKERDVEYVAEKFNAEKVALPLQRELLNMLQLNSYFTMPLAQVVEQNEELLVDQVIPNIMDALFERLFDNVEVFMEKLRLQDIIKDQVDAFPVERLEEMVLSIMKSELGMITYLGALLGGLIGIVQGVIAIFI